MLARRSLLWLTALTLLLCAGCLRDSDGSGQDGCKLCIEGERCEDGICIPI